MSAFSALIHATEQKWLDVLYEHSRTLFNRVHLPSHDHIHHLRVWQFAKEILQSLRAAGIAYSPDEMEALIIAVFFHDMGMVVTRKKEHGLESRRFCKDFFAQYPHLLIAGLDYVLEIIEKHDEKNYAVVSASPIKPALHTILNISDDLDAFGAIGVYRYAEIYFLRGITIDMMPAAVIPNVESRFNYFCENLAFLNPLVHRHRLRHEYTRQFFRTLADHYAGQPAGTCGAVEVLRILTEFSSRPDLSIEYLLSLVEDKSLDPFAARFFRDFHDEWNSAPAIRQRG